MICDLSGELLPFIITHLIIIQFIFFMVHVNYKELPRSYRNYFRVHQEKRAIPAKETRSFIRWRLLWK